jgi:hypothetical protein
MNLDPPDGRRFEQIVDYPPGEWSAAKDHADVRVGANRFTGDLHGYRIQTTAEEISVDVTLSGEDTSPACPTRRSGASAPQWRTSVLVEPC